MKIHAQLKAISANFRKIHMQNFAQTKNSSEIAQNPYTCSVLGTKRNRSTCFGTKYSEVVGPTARKGYQLIFPRKQKCEERQ